MRRLVFAICLLALAVGGGWVLGQQQKPNPPGLVTGADIGIQINGQTPDGKPRGVLMVRQNGEWREVVVGRAPGLMPLESR